MESICTQEEKTQKYKDDCLIFFQDTPGKRWWDYVFHTRPGFKHCFLLYWDGWARRFILLDWRMNRVDVMCFFDFEIEEFFAHADKWDGTVVRFMPVSEVQSRFGFPYKSCVTMIQHFLALQHYLILTPFQLYRRLMQLGGEVITEWSENSDSILKRVARVEGCAEKV